MIYIEDVLPSFGHNTTCSLVRVTLLSFVLDICSWSEALHLRRIIFGMHMVFLSLEGLQLGFDYALHGFVSKFCMQNFFIEWL
jgi:hypothetical protein